MKNYSITEEKSTISIRYDIPNTDRYLIACGPKHQKDRLIELLEIEIENALHPNPSSQENPRS